MGKIFYNIFTGLYFFAISIFASFSPKARLFKEGRKDLFIRLEKDLNANPGKYIWFHCASLGEFEQGRPVIEAFKKKFPRHKVLLTFFSPSGYEIRKNYQAADLIYYLPEDTAVNANKFLDLLKPQLVLFIKYEFWFNFIDAIHRHNIPLLSISSIFREEQLFFKPYGSFYRGILRKFTHFFVQEANSLQLLNSIGIKSVTVAGDTRFDRVHDISKSIKNLPNIQEFIQNNEVFVAGSIWDHDLQVLAPLIKDFPHIKFIIAPHEVHEDVIANIINVFPDSSRLTKGIDNDKQCLIIDNIGFLSSLYQFADYAFIGGAYGKGLHNILEAATFGMPIFFGDKNYKKFVEAVNLIKAGGAFPVSDYEELKLKIDGFRKESNLKIEVSEISKQFVLKNIGATHKIMEFSKMLLKD
ncbi:MAG: 3-deoxy-D-manno-octulosonic acid transferase [Bacteroidota bacterium]|nr:3-deoxy-D-manno-octulosonic acid transferase [Bacteroidota bacterium]